MSTLSMQVGKRIKELREAKGMKQVELADLIDMEATNLSKLEKGVHLPKEDNLNKITNALGVEIKDLFPTEISRNFIPFPCLPFQNGIKIIMCT